MTEIIKHKCSCGEVSNLILKNFIRKSVVKQKIEEIERKYSLAETNPFNWFEPIEEIKEFLEGEK